MPGGGWGEGYYFPGPLRLYLTGGGWGVTTPNGMTARARGGHHRARPNALSISLELQAVFKLFARLVGENALHQGSAAEVVKTISALVLCDFRSDRAAMMLNVSAETVRMRVHRIKTRVMENLRETSFSLPVRPSIEQNQQRWDPSTFDEHSELSAEAEVG